MRHGDAVPMTAGPIDRQTAFTGTREVAGALRFDEDRLAEYMAAHVDGFEGPVTVRQFKGGQSNPTYQVLTPGAKYVLRRKPPGKLLPSAHAVDREYRVISALHAAGFPVARPYCLCTDDEVIGTMFYVMELVEGRVFWVPDVPGVDRDERTAIYDAMNDTIARLHGFDYRAAGLEDFGKPAGYVTRQIKRWSGQYVQSETRKVDEMERLMAWLPEACPPDSGASIVHGDFRLDNMIIHPTEPKVLAVLDWELSTLGDPVGDFTYHLMPYHMPRSDGGAGTGSLVGVDLGALGIPAMEDYIAAYCRRTGRDGIGNLDFYFAYNFFRLAAILQGIVGRVRDGTAANANATAMESQVLPLAREAWAYAVKAGAA
jgi:aminoglycoside phosphotransferase (APT) family kinase protein